MYRARLRDSRGNPENATEPKAGGVDVTVRIKTETDSDTLVYAHINDVTSFSVFVEIFCQSQALANVRSKTQADRKSRQGLSSRYGSFEHQSRSFLPQTSERHKSARDILRNGVHQFRFPLYYG